MLEARILSLTGVEGRKSRWGHGAAYWIGSREFTHFHREDLLDIRVGREALRALPGIRLDPRVVFRIQASDWIQFRLEKLSDVDDAFELVKLACRNSRTARR